MKKRDLNLKTLAMMGLAAGLLTSTHVSAEDKNKTTASQPQQEKKSSDGDSKKDSDNYDANLFHDYTEEELLRILTPEGKRMYNSLTPEGKQLALDTASQTCNGQNKCKGLGACESKDHACAGKNSCEGQGKCAHADKNTAVKLVYEKMKQKRQKAAE